MARVERVKLNFRFPPALRDRLDALAQREGVSINDLLLRAVENYLPFRERWHDQEERRRQRAASEIGRRVPIGVVVPRVGANQPCPCGSGLKYKRCHGKAAVV